MLVCRVPRELKQRLEAEIKARQMKKGYSQLVREALEVFLNGHGSAHQKAPHLCGAVTLPPGAATSEDYLKQYDDRHS